MITTRLRAGVFVIPLAAVAGGVGVYVVARAFWPWLLIWWPWLLAGVAGLAIYGAWWLWWRLPKWQAERLRLTIRDPKARADVEDNFRKTIGQLLGGAAVLVGAGLAYLQFQQQQQAAHDLLISNQVAKGFELLGNKDNQIQQRLGGIYALEAVMNTSKEYRQPVLEALCAFVREQTKAKTDKGAPASDIRAALMVIGSRGPNIVMRSPLELVRTPTGGRVGFRAEGVASFSNSQIIQIILGRSWANLENAHIPKADLRMTDLRGAQLNGVDLSEAKLWSATLSGADLSGADLSGADLGNADLSEANLGGTILSGATLTYTVLSWANLREAKFLTQQQLDEACGTDVKLDPGLTIKPCPATPAKPQVRPPE